MPGGAARWLTDPWHDVHKVITYGHASEMPDGWWGFGNPWLHGPDEEPADQTSVEPGRPWYLEMPSWWVVVPPFVLLADPPIDAYVDEVAESLTLLYRDGHRVPVVGGRLMPGWEDLPSRSFEEVMRLDDPALRLRLLATVSDDEVTPERVAAVFKTETNAEIRQLLVRKVGAEALTEAWGARVVSKDRFGELWLVPGPPPPQPDAWRTRVTEPMKFVRVWDATERADGRPEYWLSVPLTVTSAREAVAWSFGMHTYEYRPEVET